MTFAERYGPWALIAGASEGTGASFARQLAAAGLNLLLVARREGPLAELAQEITQQHDVDVRVANVDLVAEDAAVHLKSLAGGREIGLMVFNAGADPTFAHLLDQPVDDALALARRNMLAVLEFCHIFAGPMRKRGRGGVLICGSGAGYGGIPGMATYCGTNAFKLAFLEGLWAELRPHGVDVLYNVMGQTDTPAYRQWLADQGRPLPTDWADPDAVAARALAHLDKGPVLNWGLADDEAGYAGTSAAARRARVEMIAKAMTKSA